MTIPVERMNAVNHTREFLYELLNPQKTPRIPKYIREQALHCLRHYPSEFDMDMISFREDMVCNEGLSYKVFGKGHK